MTRRFDLRSPAFKRDPMPTWAAMQAAGPAVPCRVPILGPMTLLTTHAACAEMLKDNRRFKVEPRNTGQSRDTRLRWWMPRAMPVLMRNMLSLDDPDHRRLRGAVDQAFSRRGLQAMAPRIEAMAEALLDRAGPRFDLVEAYARELPLTVICELLGIPEAERRAYTRAFRPLARSGRPLGIALSLWRLGGLLDRMRAEIARARAGESEGLIAELVRPGPGEAALSEDELVSMVFLLFVAGHETTTHLISGGVLALLQHPEQLARLRAEPGLMPLAVEEMLRWVAPVQITKPRFVAEDTEIAGAPLRRGSAVAACIGAANADPAIAAEPARFDIARRANQHLSFSTGVHFCLGFQLARMETAAALTALLARAPALRRADRRPAAYSRRFGLRGLRRLDVALGPA